MYYYLFVCIVCILIYTIYVIDTPNTILSSHPTEAMYTAYLDTYRNEASEGIPVSEPLTFCC